MSTKTDHSDILKDRKVRRVTRAPLSPEEAALVNECVAREIERLERAEAKGGVRNARYNAAYHIVKLQIHRDALRLKVRDHFISAALPPLIAMGLDASEAGKRAIAYADAVLALRNVDRRMPSLDPDGEPEAKP